MFDKADRGCPSIDRTLVVRYAIGWIFLFVLVCLVWRGFIPWSERSRVSAQVRQTQCMLFFYLPFAYFIVFILSFQYVTEKMGAAEGTKMDDDFVEMERVCVLQKHDYFLFVPNWFVQLGIFPRKRT